MTRVETRCSPQAVSIKPKHANLRRFLSVIAIAAFAAATYFFVKRPTDSLGDPSDQFVVKTIPRIYSKLEGVDPEEREVFQGFRTSFLPHEEIVLARTHDKAKREIYEGNVTSDILIWGASDEQHGTPTRVKRRSHFTFTSQDYEWVTSRFFILRYLFWKIRYPYLLLKRVANIFLQIKYCRFSNKLRFFLSNEDGLSHDGSLRNNPTARTEVEDFESDDQDEEYDSSDGVYDDESEENIDRWKTIYYFKFL